MTITIETIACLSDNYAFLVHDKATNSTALIDAPEAAPIESALKARGWALDLILITHHHADHIDGVGELRQTYGASIVGAKADAHRLPALDIEVVDGDALSFADTSFAVIDVSGHTVGHIAFHLQSANAVFTADSLMALGCGRLFEGSPDQMWKSLSKIAALPAQTMVYSGHEYTESNAKFALTIEPANENLQARARDIVAARAQNKATVPSQLGLELATNPFLRASDPQVKSAVGMANAPDVEVFAEIRNRKDQF